MKVIQFCLRVIPAIIMLQTLRYKFGGDPLSIYIFSTVGIEPWGRWLTGCMELVASMLLIFPNTVTWGALMTVGVMTGALMSHILFLGIEVQGDGGALFMMAMGVWTCSVVLVYLNRRQIWEWVSRNK